MLPRSVIVVAVGLLCLTAGCQTASDGATPTPTAEGDATPTAGDSVTPTAEAQANESVESDRLLRRHAQALDGQSYAAEVSVRVRHPNGSVGQRTTEYRIERADRYYAESRVSGPVPGWVRNYTVFANETHEVTRATLANGTAQTDVDTGIGVQNVSLPYRMANLLDGFALRSDGRSLSGNQTGEWPVDSGQALSDGYNGTVDGEIRDGILRRLTVSGGAHVARTDRTVQVRITYRVVDIRDVDAPSPPVREALNESG